LDTTRRTFLQGAAVGAALVPALTPGTAAASLGEGSARIHEQLRVFRGREDAIRREYLDSVYDDRPAAADREVRPHIHALAGGLAALSSVKDIEQMPIEDQVHPAVQRAIRAAATSVGAAIARCGDLFEVFLSDESPERETHLRAGLRGVRMSVRDWPTTTGRQNMLEQTLGEVEAETNPGALLRRARKSLARIRKAERVAAELDARGEGTAVFEVRDAETLARVDAGRARWAGEPDDGYDDGGIELPEEPTLGGGLSSGMHLALGIVILAVGCAVGGILVLAGLCLTLCQSPGGVFVLLGGMAILGLSIWGGITLIRRGRKMRGQEGSERGEADAPAGATVVQAETHVPVLGADGWVDSGVERTAEATVWVRGTGLVRFPARWAADADGNGETAGVDALVPTAPLGALVGRVGDDTFFLGSDGVVPEGAPGRVLLAVNQRRGEGHTPKGHFAARLTRLVPAVG
jgi:hypothetical protein